MNPNTFWQTPLGQMLSQLFSGGGRAAPMDAPAAQQDPMQELVKAMMQSQERITGMQLDTLNRQPQTNISRRTLSGNNVDDVASGAKVEGLNSLYKMNPQLAPASFSSPTSPERFNTGVYGNPAGPPPLQPATGSRMEGGVEVPMTGADIFGQMAGIAAKPKIPLNMTDGLQGSVINAPKGTVGTGPFNSRGGVTMNNGVQTPMDMFLKGANNLPQGLDSSNYQMGLSPEDIQTLVANPKFGMPGAQSAPQPWMPQIPIQGARPKAKPVAAAPARPSRTLGRRI